MKLSLGSPLGALLVTALAVTSALGWFGWRLFDLQRAIEERRLRDRLEIGADALAGDVRGALAEVGEQLSAWLSSPDSPFPEVRGGVVFAFAHGRIRVSPQGSLPFVPHRPHKNQITNVRCRMPSAESAPTQSDARLCAGLEAVETRLRVAEALEFQSGDLSVAVAAYRATSTHEDQTIRAAALLRLGRVLSKSHDVAGALNAYGRLEALGQVDVEGYPAELAALDGQRLTLIRAGRRDEAQRLTDRIVTGIDQGRWLIARATAEDFRDSLAAPPRPASWELATALTNQWEQWGNSPPERGLRLVAGDGRPVLLLWRTRDEDVVAVAAFAEHFLPSPSVPGIAFEITDTDGARIAGASPPRSPVTRITGDARSPSWTLKVWASGAQEAAAPLSSASTLALAVAMTVALFLWSTVYFTARAMRREARVARLQSDFVSAVSHEFRSPLTTMRQLAELLEMGEVPSEERRQTYYEVLGKESRRLQRLVETLLNFGRMEAGAERYRLEPVSVPGLVRQVAQEIEAQHSHQGLRIDINGSDEGMSVLGDADALALTIRNLLDNAVKYSPGRDSVRVEWAMDGDQISIRVMDHGLGIDPSEKDAIFGKFVRGRAAAAANVKGTGVGLAMVRQVLTAHGGQISVQSEVGLGSTFTVLLPAAH